MFPHRDKGISPPEEEGIQLANLINNLSYHFKVIPAKAVEFSFFGMRADSASSSHR